MANDFPKTKQRFSAALRVPPTAQNRALIGVAFDYHLRFHLQRERCFAIARPWVTEQAQELISHYGKDGILFGTGKGYMTSGKVTAPQCATKPTSMLPGSGSFQSGKGAYLDTPSSRMHSVRELQTSRGSP